MFKIILLLASVVLCGQLSSQGGRFVFGQISDYRADQYMLDTQTGRLWQVVQDADSTNRLREIFYVSDSLKITKENSAFITILSPTPNQAKTQVKTTNIPNTTNSLPFNIKRNIMVLRIASKIKDRYPVYSSMADRELVKRFSDKYFDLDNAIKDGQTPDEIESRVDSILEKIPDNGF